MQPWMSDVPKAILEVKRDLRQRIPDLKERFAALSAWVEREVAAVLEEKQQGGVVPELRYEELARGEVPAEARGAHPPARLRHRPRRLPGGAGGGLERRHRRVHRAERLPGQGGEEGRPRPLLRLAGGRQSPNLPALLVEAADGGAAERGAGPRPRGAEPALEVRRGPRAPAFDPDRECLYADRLRRRSPGDRTLGLSPHADGGSVERWCDPSYQQVYADVLFGDPSRYDPFDGQHRASTEEIPSPAVCSVFRTYQGWTGLTRQGAGDGTLQLVPIAGLMGWILLRALQDDVPEGELCGAKAGTALPLERRWHELAWPAITSLPTVEPGDTVWWHNDLIHAVEPEHLGKSSSNVIYIAAVPWCEKNAAFLPRQLQAFKEGRSGPDFAAHDLEVEFEGRATVDDLTPLGRKQMGVDPW